MSRPRTPIGSHGAISVQETSPGKHRARTRFRFDDGRYRQVERFGASPTKAINELKRAILDLQRYGNAGLSSRTTLAELGRQWLKSREELGRSDQTIEKYGYAVHAHLIPEIGGLLVGEATLPRLQTYLRKVEQERGHGAAKNSRNALSGMLGLAARTGLIDRNPVADLEQISTRGKSAASKAIPLDKLPGFYRALRSDPVLRREDLVELFEFMLASGLRVAEAVAVEAADLDHVAGTVTVNAIHVRKKGAGIVRQEYAKTDRSTHRTIPLPAATMDMLVRRLRRVGEFGPLIFPTLQFERRDPSNVQRWLKERAPMLGFPDLKTHSFRKTAATVLERAGLSPTEIADYLGHEDPSLTQSTYLNTAPDLSRGRDAMDAHLRSL